MQSHRAGQQAFVGASLSLAISAILARVGPFWTEYVGMIYPPITSVSRRNPRLQTQLGPKPARSFTS
jgi:hypothetical protein